MYATMKVKSLMTNITMQYYSGEEYCARRVKGTSLLVLENERGEEIIVDDYEFAVTLEEEE